MNEPYQQLNQVAKAQHCLHEACSVISAVHPSPFAFLIHVSEAYPITFAPCPSLKEILQGRNHMKIAERTDCHFCVKTKVEGMLD